MTRIEKSLAEQIHFDDEDNAKCILEYANVYVQYINIARGKSQSTLIPFDPRTISWVCHHAVSCQFC